MESLSFTVLKEEISEPDLNAKVIIIGDTGVGKSCLVLRATKDEFKETHEITIGAEFGSYNAKIDNTTIKLQIWDTAGQESFKSMIRVFYKGAQFALLVFDLTRDDTLTKAADWLKEIRENADPGIPILLIGTHSDQGDQIKIPSEKISQFKETNQLINYIETSSKTGHGVTDVFKFICKNLYQKSSSISKKGETLSDGKKPEKKKCCK
jgi:Ras-related protein Rab-2A